MKPLREVLQVLSTEKRPDLLQVAAERFDLAERTVGETFVCGVNYGMRLLLDMIIEDEELR